MRLGITPQVTKPLHFYSLLIPKSNKKAEHQKSQENNHPVILNVRQFDDSGLDSWLGTICIFVFYLLLIISFLFNGIFAQFNPNNVFTFRTFNFYKTI